MTCCSELRLIVAPFVASADVQGWANRVVGRMSEVELKVSL
jgi:hypothetical protein